MFLTSLSRGTVDEETLRKARLALKQWKRFLRSKEGKPYRDALRIYRRTGVMPKIELPEED